MDIIQEAAIVTAITIENRSLEFYRAVTSRVTDKRTRYVFELLAKEESEHLDSFCKLYQGDEYELLALLNSNNIYADPYYRSLIESIEGDACEKDALQLALKEEQACLEWYSVFVETIRAPHIREVFVKILDETNKHGELISEEYMRLMKMVASTDQDIFVRE